VELTRVGSGPAFDVIVDRYRAPLQGFCARSLPSGRAEDVVQQTFLSAYVGIVGTDCELLLRPWLYRIARNAVIDTLRERAVIEVEIDDQVERDESGFGAEQPDRVLERRQDVWEMVSAVNSLPSRQRDAIVLRELEGRSCDEIATKLGVSGGAARQLLLRARATLRAGLGAISPPALLGRLLPDFGGALGARLPELCGSAGAGAVALKLSVAAVAAGSLAGGMAIAPLVDGAPRVHGGEAFSRPGQAITSPAAPPLHDRNSPPGDAADRGRDAGSSPSTVTRPEEDRKRMVSVPPPAEPGDPGDAAPEAVPPPSEPFGAGLDRGREGMPVIGGVKRLYGDAPAPGFDGVPEPGGCGRSQPGSAGPAPGTDGTPAAAASCGPKAEGHAPGEDAEATDESSSHPAEHPPSAATQPSETSAGGPAESPSVQPTN